MKFKYAILMLLLVTLVLALGCGKKPPPPPPAPPPVTETPPPPPPPPPPPAPEVAPLSLTAIHFDYDKSDLRSDALDIMAQNSKSLTDHPDVRVRIEGNCDERGTAQYNMALGQRRADAARDYLVKYGIDAGRIETISYGKTKPMDLGHNEDAWAKNRRDDIVEINK